MKNKDEALKMAIEAMEMAMEADWELNASHVFNILHSITVCKEALAQPAQEPVGEYLGNCSDGDLIQLYDDLKKGTKLYTHPAPSCQECENLKHDLEGYMDANKALINREWQGLSDDETQEIIDNLNNPFAMIRVAEMQLKEKNHG